MKYMKLRQHAWCWGACLCGAVWLDACGAMNFEPAVPDEPVATPEHAPRLMRSDAGRSDAAAAGPDDQRD
jgi:hypothetical protein